MKDTPDKILEKIRSYYGAKISSYGPCPEGVDWNGRESQILRFQQLIKVLRNTDHFFSINDLGCGYGALLEYLLHNNFECDYRGFDISGEMIACAKGLWSKLSDSKISFQFVEGNNLYPSDYTVASGIFNVKQGVDNSTWIAYVIDVLNKMHDNSSKGFAFNVLTFYSDPPFMKDYLYYADPCFLFDYCKRHYSRDVALLHDYGLYEFTIIVRKCQENGV